MAEDWAPFVNLGVSRKKTLLFIF